MAALDQARNAIRCIIDENPCVVDITRALSAMDNGFGAKIPNAAGAKQTVKVRGRLSVEASSVQRDHEVASGPDTSFTMFITTDYVTPINKGEIFDYDGNTWTIGPVTELKRFGGVIGHHAALTKGTEVNLATA